MSTCPVAHDYNPLDPETVLADGAVDLDGDDAVGRRVVEGLNFLF